MTCGHEDIETSILEPPELKIHDGVLLVTGACANARELGSYSRRLKDLAKHSHYTLAMDCTAVVASGVMSNLAALLRQYLTSHFAVHLYNVNPKGAVFANFFMHRYAHAVRELVIGGNLPRHFSTSALGQLEVLKIAGMSLTWTELAGFLRQVTVPRDCTLEIDEVDVLDDAEIPEMTLPRRLRVRCYGTDEHTCEPFVGLPVDSIHATIQPQCWNRARVAVSKNAKVRSITLTAAGPVPGTDVGRFSSPLLSKLVLTNVPLQPTELAAVLRNHSRLRTLSVKVATGPGVDKAARALTKYHNLDALALKGDRDDADGASVLIEALLRGLAKRRFPLKELVLCDCALTDNIAGQVGALARGGTRSFSLHETQPMLHMVTPVVFEWLRSCEWEHFSADPLAHVAVAAADLRTALEEE